MVFLLDSEKQSFRVDNVQKFIKIKAAIVKIQCFENESDFLLREWFENMSIVIWLD